MIYADASFLVALFVERDDHWQDAWKWWTHQDGLSLVVSRLTIFEAENTIRGLVVSKQWRSSEARLSLNGIHRGLLDGVLIRRSIPENRLFPHATRLSQTHTLGCTFGALDILHIATALELGATTCLSFDQHQRKLAAAEALLVHPS